MSRTLARARESWLSDDVPEHFGDAALLCQNGIDGCAANARCALEGFCFRGLASAEVRRGFHERLAVLEHEMNELRMLALPQRIEAARKKLDEQIADVRGVVLDFDQKARARRPTPAEHPNG